MGISLNKYIQEEFLFDFDFEHRAIEKKDLRKIYRAERRQRLRASELRYRREREVKRKLNVW